MKFKKLGSLFLVFAILLTTLSLSACASDSKTPTPSEGKPAAVAPSAPAASSTPASPAQPAAKENPYFEFNLSMHDPITSNNGVFYQAWADKILKETDGHVKITIFASNSLAKGPDVADMVETSGVDIGWICTSFYQGQFPLTDITTVPMIGFGNAITSTKALWELYEKYEELRNEWASYKVLFLYGNPGMVFGSNVTPIRKPADIHGQKLRATAGLIVDLMKSLGAAPIMMPPPDMYEALSKNNINGFSFEPAGITNFKLQEVTKYITDMPMYDAVFCTAMNWDKWNSLPAEYQKVIEDNSLKAGSFAAAEDFNNAAEKSKKVIAEAGTEWIQVTDEEIAAFQKAADPVIATWPSTIKLKDFDAEAYMKDAIELAKKYSQ